MGFSQARPLFKDRKNFGNMIDPNLRGQYPVRGLYQALAIAAMCVQEQPAMRPVTSDVVNALTFLASQKYDPSHSTRSSRRPSSSSVDYEEKRLLTDDSSRVMNNRKAVTE